MRSGWVLCSLFIAGAALAASPRNASKSELATIREALRLQHQNVDGARFEGVRFGNDGRTVCGTVSFPDAQGAYTASSPFLALYFKPEKRGEKPSAFVFGLSDPVIIRERCAEKGL
ncbi:hypothetical protein [Arenimonas sp.]|uniref:hypothetical protein n=1 Tax=Arenimonas sp. TaxID=1872635 RepID=UPI0039E58A70